jgi:hypothetical protein
MLLPWIVFPAVLCALATGCGLLVERLSGRPPPAGTLLPCGLALVVVAGLFPPMISGAARLTTPLVVVLAVAGFVVGHRRRPDPWGAGVGAAVYAVFGAPVLLSGRATFTGYIKLDDTATYLAMLDRFMSHGYDVAGLAPSTYEATLSTSLAYGYPMGSLVPLGIGHVLVRTDTAWLWQPYLSVLAAALGLALYGLLAPLVPSRPVRAVCAFVAAQAALLYGYALWGGVKELAAAALLVLLGALVPMLPGEGGMRRLLPAAVALAAFVGVLSEGGAVWLAPAALVAVVLVIVRGGRRALVSATGLVVALAALSIPTIDAATRWLRHAGGFTKGTELGNLGRSLRPLQVVGVWPAGDFRTGPVDVTATHVLIAIVIVAACAGVVVAWRRQAWGVLAYLLSALGGALAYVEVASPWIGGKALASASPAVLALALVPAAVLVARRGPAFRVGGAVLAAAIAGGVVWSNVLAYHAVWLAPNVRLGELETIGSRFAGDGPALMTEYEPYGVRHFLRNLQAQGASELRRSAIPLRTGAQLATGETADIDAFPLSSILPFRTLVLRRSPSASRPPSVYRLVWQGRYYDVWERPLSGGRAIVDHLAVGTSLEAAGIPSCNAVLALAHEAGTGGKLAAVFRQPNAVLSLTGARTVATGFYGERSDALYLTRAFTSQWTLRVRAAAPYDLGVDGSFEGRLELFVDGHRLESERSELNWPNQYQPFGSRTLSVGEHTIRLVYHGSSLLPGTAGAPAFGTGPVIAGVDPSSLSVTTVPVADARSLCGQSLDWVEALAG